MKIPKRIAQALINSLKGGVVPRVGLPYVTVGRKDEIDALLRDVDIIADGGASFRFIVGKYGSGKSFLLQTIRNYVMAKNFVVVDADLSPERRLQGTRGQGLAKKLALLALDYAREQGFKRCYLETTAFLKEAVGLYERLGFEHIDGPLGCTGHVDCEVRMLKTL